MPDYYEEQRERIADHAKRAIVEQILEYSDIVWSKYGSETIEELAEKIVKKIKK